MRQARQILLGSARIDIAGRPMAVMKREDDGGIRDAGVFTIRKKSIWGM